LRSFKEHDDGTEIAAEQIGSVLAEHTVQNLLHPRQPADFSAAWQTMLALPLLQ